MLQIDELMMVQPLWMNLAGNDWILEVHSFPFLFPQIKFFKDSHLIQIKLISRQVTY